MLNKDATHLITGTQPKEYTVKTMKNILKVLSFLAVTGLTLTACGSAASGKPASSGLQQIKDRGYINIATSGNFTPFAFRDSANKIVGVDADWAKIIGTALGVEVRWTAVDFKGIIPGVLQNRFDLALSGMHVTEERKKSVNFSTPYAYDSTVALFRTGAKAVESPADVKGKVVCTIAGSVFETTVKKIGGYAQLVQFTGVAESLQGLKDGRCDVMVGGRAASLFWINSGHGAGFEVSLKDLAGEPVGVAVSKDQKELLAAVNDAIKEALPKDCQPIAEKWTGSKFPASICG